MSINFQAPITIALAKGRILKDTLPMFAAVGIEPKEDPDSTRKLILDTNHPEVRLVLIRPTDVPTYVQWGAADLGIAGKDTLLEHGGEGLYEPLDLEIAKCRLMVCGKPGASLNGQKLRIATKYEKSAREYFAKRAQQVEIIKLYGSMELAPLVDLSDLIVDLVETGGTLRANGLVEHEFIADISSRLVVNKASWKTKHESVAQLTQALAEVIRSRRDSDS